MRPGGTEGTKRRFLGYLTGLNAPRVYLIEGEGEEKILPIKVTHTPILYTWTYRRRTEAAWTTKVHYKFTCTLKAAKEPTHGRRHTKYRPLTLGNIYVFSIYGKEYLRKQRGSRNHPIRVYCTVGRRRI